MKLICGILIYTFIPLFNGICQVRNDSVQFIAWNMNYKLHPSDFWGRDKKDNIKIYEMFKAVTVVELKYNITWEDDLPNIFVSNCFNRKSSFIKERIENIEYLMRHEQLHFDIAELCTRLIRKEILELRKSKIDSVSVYENVVVHGLAKLDSLNSLYDLETSHGISVSKQTIWQEKISSELKKLEVYYIECECLCQTDSTASE